ncbi:ATP-binding cassette domain-containing protein [Lentibacillus saliphilus]|uniref:ATP-binding cassette domain-containing protein n=1 Tax=Lentibacillus saliphilus TaxID=2737028 RepID=UPI001C2FBF17|nr:ABC transporter ATP-binding protein [Lentibacillus saliphilus]
MALIELKDVSVTKKQTKILDMSASSISIEAGDKIGIIGANGAGKTTLIKVILNLIEYEGDVHRNIQAQDVGVQMQNNEFSDLMKVKEIISLVCNCSIRDQRIQDDLSRFQLHPLLNKKLSHLSGGEKQRLTIFLVMFNDPKLLIFDEITSGLDFESREAMIQFIQTVTNHKTLLIVSHYFTEIEKLANKILMLHKGQILAYGRIDDLFSEYQIYSSISIDKEAPFPPSDLRYVKTTDKKVLITKNKEEEERLVELLRKQMISFAYKPKDIETLYTFIRDHQPKGDVS